MSGPMQFLNLDGVPSKTLPADGRLAFIADGLGGFILTEDHAAYDITDLCRRLDRAFQSRILAGLDGDRLIPGLPMFVVTGGHNSEAPISKDNFERLLRLAGDFPHLNRFLYLYDCERLVSSISGCRVEVRQVMGEFYRLFNAEALVSAPPLTSDGVVTSQSPIVTQLFANLNFIFIRLHSLLDYVVKLAIEIERPQTDFTRYGRMQSHAQQYGDRRRLPYNGAVGTVLEACEFMVMVESLRNHLIHDGLLDERPKVYERLAAGKVVERFVLLPDMREGRFERSGGRGLFYGGEDKINLRLPALILEFEARLAATLEQVLARFPQAES